VEPVDRLGRDVDRGVEAEREVGGAEIVVDRLRHADDVDAELRQAGGNPEGVFTADGDQRVDARFLQVGLDAVQATVHPQRVGPRRTDDRAASREDPAHLSDSELLGVVLERSSPAVAKTDHLRVVLCRAFAHDRAENRVETWAVAPTGQHPDPHRPAHTLRRRQRGHPSE
jgi:hypothetical protein